MMRPIESKRLKRATEEQDYYLLNGTVFNTCLPELFNSIRVHMLKLVRFSEKCHFLCISPVMFINKLTIKFPSNICLTTQEFNISIVGHQVGLAIDVVQKNVTENLQHNFSSSENFDHESSLSISENFGSGNAVHASVTLVVMGIFVCLCCGICIIIMMKRRKKRSAADVRLQSAIMADSFGSFHYRVTHS